MTLIVQLSALDSPVTQTELEKRLTLLFRSEAKRCYHDDRLSVTVHNVIWGSLDPQAVRNVADNWEWQLRTHFIGLVQELSGPNRPLKPMHVSVNDDLSNKIKHAAEELDDDWNIFVEHGVIAEPEFSFQSPAMHTVIPNDMAFELPTNVENYAIVCCSVTF